MISDLNDFTFFLIYQSHRCLLPSFESIYLSVQEERPKIDFQDSRHGGQLGFPIRTILAIFDIPVTLMLPTKFGVNLLFGSGKEAKNRFSRPWISDQNNFSYI